jgi:ferredoxin/predicted CopG family antitoxin
MDPKNDILNLENRVQSFILREKGHSFECQMSEQQAATETRTLTVNSKALEKLTWAKREEESYSDVILRLVSTKLDGLQRRGEKDIVTKDNRRLILSVEQNLCMGAESCVRIAPEIFALDESRLNAKQYEPLGMREVMDREVHSEPIISAAQTCPYKAIKIVDAETGEQIFP